MSLREEILDDVAVRFLTDPSFNARVSLTRQIVTAEQRLNPGLLATGETYAAVALVLAERKIDGGERENDPQGLMSAVEELLRCLYTCSMVPRKDAGVQQAITAVQVQLTALS